MSRSGYDDCFDAYPLDLYRQAVENAVHGRRGQKLLRELLTAMDAMPEKMLVDGALQRDGSYCALGVVGAARGVNMEGLDPYDPHQVAAVFDIARCMAAEIAFVNDDDFVYSASETPEQRWLRVRKWVVEQLND